VDSGVSQAARMWNDVAVRGEGRLRTVGIEDGKNVGETVRRDASSELRDDSFGRILGDEWIAVEPGIYRLASDLHAEAERERRRQEEASLSDSLLDAIPGRDDHAEPVEGPPEPERSGRGWFRRK
jgi:hypothetical protein